MDLKSKGKLPQKQAVKESHIRNDYLSVGPIAEV